jgi:hypothetical protein
VLEVLLDVLKMAPKNLRCDGNQRDHRCCEDLAFYAVQVSYMQRIISLKCSCGNLAMGWDDNMLIVLFQKSAEDHPAVSIRRSKIV